MEGESDLCSDSPGDDVATLKQALRLQHQVLQKLYIELDEEREASTTAANEALSMILRLQGEKAAEKMEAHQYKRMAEEKIKHAQESIESFEELMYRKEMETASLMFQVQAYRHRLLSLGFEDSEIGKMELLGIPYCRRDDDQITTLSDAYEKSTRNLRPDDVGDHRRVRRNTSLPNMRFNDSYLEKGILQVEPEQEFTELGGKDREQEFILRKKTALTGVGNQPWKKGDHEKLSTVEEDSLDVFEEYETENCNSYRERNEHMDEQVNELRHEKNLDECFDSEWLSENKELHPKAASRSCSWYSAVSSEPFYDSCRENRMEIGGKFSCSTSQAEDPNDLSKFDTFNPYLGREKSGETTIHTINFHDIFEVPQEPRDYKQCESLKQVADPRQCESLKQIADPRQCESLKQMADPMLEEIEEPYFSKDPECIKNKLSKAIYSFKESKLLKAKNPAVCNYEWVLAVPNLDQKLDNPYQSEVQQLKKRLELLENDRSVKQEPSIGKEELQLLREISKRLNTIETQIKNPQTKERNHPEDTSLVSIMEAMLSFSL